MRNLIVAVVLALAPFALWVAGCRQNDQAAFPKGPEVKSLARAPQPAGRGTVAGSGLAAAPDIPAAIDPEVLNSPDQPTFARIRAVMDREAQLSNQYSAPGLFVLPRQDYHEMAALPEPVPAIDPAPALSSREFWSRPAAPVGAPALDRQFHPGDVSAMAPAAPLPGPAPAPAPAPVARYGRPAPAEPFLPPEGIPGLFMGTDQIDPGPLSLAPPAAHPAGGSGLPPQLSSAAFNSLSIDELKAGMAKAAGPKQDPPLPLAWAPAPRQAPAAGGTVESLLRNTDIRQALAPLPDISNLAGAPPAPAAAVGPAGFGSESEMATLAALAEFMPAPPIETAKPAASAPAARDLYMTDFWTKEPAKPPVLPPLEGLSDLLGQLDAPKAVVDREVAGPAAPIPAAEKAAPPKKVSLLPQRTLPRPGGLTHIDDAIEPPPLKF